MEQSAITAALIGVILCLTKFIEKVAAKKANGSANAPIMVITHRIEEIEENIKEVGDSVDDFKRAFFEFREETRIHRAIHRED